MVDYGKTIVTNKDLTFMDPDGRHSYVIKKHADGWDYHVMLNGRDIGSVGPFKTKDEAAKSISRKVSGLKLA